MSNHLRRHVINNLSDFAGKCGIQSGKISPVRPRGIGWVSFTVPYCSDDIEFRPVVAHVRRRTRENRRIDFCAVFDFIGARNYLAGSPVIGNFPYQAEIPCIDNTVNHLEQLVLVPIIQVTQNGQEWAERWMRAIVRLKRLNDCPHRAANISEIVSGHCGPEVRCVIADGEGEFVFIGGRARSSLLADNGIDQMVESTSQIMDSVSEPQRPSLKRGRFIDSKNNAITGAIAIDSLQNAIRVSVCPGPKLILDGFSVFLAPGQFCPDARQIESHAP